MREMPKNENKISIFLQKHNKMYKANSIRQYLMKNYQNKHNHRIKVHKKLQVKPIIKKEPLPNFKLLKLAQPKKVTQKFRMLAITSILLLINFKMA